MVNRLEQVCLEEESEFRVSARAIMGTRAEQQDSYYVWADKRKVLAVVCDGMGGQEGGQQASRLTVKTIMELFKKQTPGEDIRLFFGRIIPILDDQVAALRKRNGRRLNAGTTLVMLYCEDDHAHWISVGDSRLYIQRADEMIQVTMDHNYALQLNEKMQQGIISQKEYDREIINGEALVSFIGIGGVHMVDMNQEAFKIQVGDRFLLATDGLTKTLEEDEIKGILENFKDINLATQTLISKVKKRSEKSEQDNTTIIGLEYRGRDL